ncbi:ATP-binding protein [Sulfitobacter sp. HNIBRBA2951]|jgi:hypothetical protein|uniref:ATP-binding protein n=1 Tax=Sulfitobacter TaxID=60136 RepID=UPI0026130B7E|nr:ATP-binding protein [uncultured Sulfitobacter sp.]
MTKSIIEIAGTIQSIRDMHFVTERDRNLMAQLSRLFKVTNGKLTHEPVRFTAGTETHGITFIEGSGGGKSTAIAEVLSNFEPLVCNPETDKPRYLDVKVESPATLRSLGVSMLLKLGGDKVSDRAKVYDIWGLVRHRLQITGTTLVWLDEAHDMFRGTLSSETDNMFKMLKSLMQGEHPVVLLLSGTERLSRITQIDPQVNRRFNKIRPRPLAFGTDNKRLVGLVTKCAERADLEVSLQDDQINRLIYASRYRFGRCIETTIHAIECALMDDVETLTIEHFELAWGQQEGCEIKENVFAAENWMGIELEDEDGDIFLKERDKAINKNKSRKKKAA